MTNKGNIQRPNLPICSLDILNLERSISGTIIIRATNNMAKIINTVTYHLPFVGPICIICAFLNFMPIPLHISSHYFLWDLRCLPTLDLGYVKVRMAYSCY